MCNGGSRTDATLYWEEEYIHILIERNLVDVLSLLASTEALYVSNVSTFPNTFALVLDSNLHYLNETNPD